MPARVTAPASIAWLLLLGLSIALSVLAAGHDTLPADTAIASWAQGLAFPGQALADAVRSVTSTQIVLAAGAALAVSLWLRGFRREAIILAAGLIILPLLQFGIKEIVDRPRPTDATEGVVELRGSFSSPSFPSGHVMSSTYLYGLLAYLALALPLPRPTGAGLAALSCTVLVLSGPANVWLGVHWPSDVLGGYAWGALLLLPAVLYCQLQRRRR
jgi:undecaprenyl-diphosphatase